MPVLANQIAHKKYIQLSRIFKMAEDCVEDRRCTDYEKLFLILFTVLSENSSFSDVLLQVCIGLRVYHLVLLSYL
jgi:hypothetical protein